MDKISLGNLFDILLDRWATFLTSIDMVIITHILNELIKDDYNIMRKTMKDIGLGCGSSFPSVFKALEKAEVFGILSVDQSEKITKITIGRKIKTEAAKRCLKI